MRISRIYIEQPLALNRDVTLDSERTHYLQHVLRLKPGNEVAVFNARDGEMRAVIADLSRHSATLQLKELIKPPATAVEGGQLHLILGLSRSERMDYAIQKSTELGVCSITPLLTEFGEVRIKPDRTDNKMRHWHKIIVGAAEQCGRLDLPQLNKPLEFDQWQPASDSVTLLLEPTASERIAIEGNGDLNLLIGPEGGFSDQEIATAKSAGYKLVKLGDNVLRTETAPVAALAILQYLKGQI